MIVVVPPGVEIFISCLVDDLDCSLQPTKPIDNKLAIRVVAIMRFMFNIFHLVDAIRYAGFNKLPAPNRNRQVSVVIARATDSDCDWLSYTFAERGFRLCMNSLSSFSACSLT